MPNDAYFHIGQKTVAGGTAFTCLLLAYALTVWPSAKRLTLAAILYSVGLFAGVAVARILGLLLAFGDSPGNSIIRSVVLPVLNLAFVAIAIRLLFIRIPQAAAIHRGKRLFIIVVPAILLLENFGSPSFEIALTVDVFSPKYLTWLLYAVLWFRIRAGYERGGAQENVLPGADRAGTSAAQ